MDEKIITIITTVYNKAKYLDTWAKSLANQTYLDKMNILIIEDCSKDDSLRLLIELVEKYALPAKIICNEKNMGLLYSIRKAYRELQAPDIRTKYFAVLDADDYYLSARKIEKAVKFLEHHEDYSAYASNYILKYRAGVEQKAISDNVRDKTFFNMKDTSFFQTAAITFRNFFTPELLDRIDYFTEEKNFGICEGDAFRNGIAFGFGKLFFENSTDAVWLCDIGDWGTLSTLEQDFCNMVGHWELFEFYRTHFKTHILTDINTNYIFSLTVNFYQKSVLDFANLMQNLDFFKFQCQPYFLKNFKKYGNNNAERIVNALLYHGEFLSDFGVVIK